MEVAAVILAAGHGARMGQHIKQLLPWRGRPLVEHPLAAAAAAGLEQIVLVLGHAAGEVLAALDPPPGLRVVVNPDHRTGQASSLRAGLAAVSPAGGAALVLLGDQPEVRPEAIRAVAAAVGVGPVVRARYAGGRPGHPVLLDRSIWPAMAALVGDAGARALLAAHPGWLREISVPGGPPPDIDTPAAYAALQGRDPVARPGPTMGR